jgi:hypothetical protein
VIRPRRCEASSQIDDAAAPEVAMSNPYTPGQRPIDATWFAAGSVDFGDCAVASGSGAWAARRVRPTSSSPPQGVGRPAHRGSGRCVQRRGRSSASRLPAHPSSDTTLPAAGARSKAMGLATIARNAPVLRMARLRTALVRNRGSDVAVTGATKRIRSTPRGRRGSVGGGRCSSREEQGQAASPPARRGSRPVDGN